MKSTTRVPQTSSVLQDASVRKQPKTLKLLPKNHLSSTDYRLIPDVINLSPDIGNDNARYFKGNFHNFLNNVIYLLNKINIGKYIKKIIIEKY